MIDSNMNLPPKYLLCTTLGIMLFMAACKNEKDEIQEQPGNEKDLSAFELGELPVDDEYYRHYWNASLNSLLTALLLVIHADACFDQTTFLDSADPQKVIDMHFNVLEQRFKHVQSMSTKKILPSRHDTEYDNLLSSIWKILQDDDLEKTSKPNISKALVNVKKQLTANPVLSEWVNKKRSSEYHFKKQDKPAMKTRRAKIIQNFNRKEVAEDDEFTHKTSLELFSFVQDIHTRQKPNTRIHFETQMMLLRTSFEYWLAKKAKLLITTPEDDSCFLTIRTKLSPLTLYAFRRSQVPFATYHMPKQWANGTLKEQRKHLQVLSEEFLKELTESRNKKR